MASGDKRLGGRKRLKGGFQIPLRVFYEGSSMENNPVMAEVISFPSRLNSAPPESISGRDGVFMEEDRNGRSGSLQNCEPDLTTSVKLGNDFIESEKKDPPLDSFQKKEEGKPKESKKEGLPGEPGPSFMDSFLIEMVHGIKKSLASVYHAIVLTMDKCDDAEIRKCSRDSSERRKSRRSIPF